MRTRPESCVQGVPQRDVAWIAGEYGAHTASHIPISDAGVWIGKAQCAARTRRTKGARAAKAPVHAGLHEAKGELHLALQAFVVEPARGRNRRRGQQVQRLLSEPQLVSSSRE